MAKTKAKSNSKAAKHDDFHWFYCMFVLLAALVGTLVFGGVRMAELKKHVISFEEQQRLAVFEDLARSYLHEADIAENATAELTGIGLSQDDEVYLDFTLRKYDSTETKKGRMHFQWDTEQQTWAHAFSYED